ncbi:ADP-ribosylation factor-like protein 2 [Citrus sinensis]|uniref:ADP-ribosylation factor-like protein 2 n=1 Tax=Citrus sinensis TaxID=2711 RepID=A0ACB8LEB2_CITSI|nr:ADP-ribosylation factor-like protein 2 [Citrus sinensis]
MPIITQYFNVKISRLREKCSFFGLHIAGPGGTMQCCPLSMPRIHAYTQTQPSFIPPRPSKSNVQLINLASFCPFKRSNDVVFDRSKSKIHHIAVFFALPAPQPRRRAQTHSLTHTARRPRCELRSAAAVAASFFVRRRQPHKEIFLLFLEMGLLSIIRKIKKKEKEMRILMVGLDNSGKTTIVLKINGEDTSVISPTLGFNIKTVTYQKYTLNIWDVGGQRTIRSYWRNYFEQTDGLVWVVDSSDLRRLDDCKMELDNLLKEERLSGASLLILANKQDINGALTPTEIAKVLNLEAMDKTRHWKIVGCSAYTGEGLLEGFDWLVQDIASRIYLLD